MLKMPMLKVSTCLAALWFLVRLSPGVAQDIRAEAPSRFDTILAKLNSTSDRERDQGRYDLKALGQDDGAALPGLRRLLQTADSELQLDIGLAL